MNRQDVALARALAAEVQPLTGSDRDYDAILDAVGGARLVLLGEASHGTHEFYRHRAQITKRLLVEKGFSAVAAEADWPDAYRVHRFVHGRSADADAIDALTDFRRFPQWMWRNADMLDFVGWLRAFDDAAGSDADKAGFFGLDLYSLHGSMQAVLDHLDKIDPAAAARARRRYACFDAFGDEPQAYGYATRFDLERSCEDEVVHQLVELQAQRAEHLRRDGYVAADEQFAAEQNARVVASAERYYREMFAGRVDTWNLRDLHMAETLDSLLEHLGPESRIVVWAHNSHLGDARATDAARRGELNLGQLMRERHGDSVVNLGFTTYRGSVSAASEWGAPVERKTVRPALAGSYEELFHEVAVPRFLLDLRRGEAVDGLAEPRLERAIGVLYLPETERMSHYFFASLPRQFDLVIHLDETRAVEPLERSAHWQRGELPETYPSTL